MTCPGRNVLQMFTMLFAVIWIYYYPEKFNSIHCLGPPLNQGSVNLMNQPQNPQMHQQYQHLSQQQQQSQQQQTQHMQSPQMRLQGPNPMMNQGPQVQGIGLPPQVSAYKV